MPRGASPQREREYEELKDEFKDEGRYKGREEEVAARIVNKQRAEHGETKADKLDDREGKTPDRGLAIDDYDKLDVDQITSKLSALAKSEIKQIRTYEQKHNNRKTLIEAIDRTD